MWNLIELLKDMMINNYKGELPRQLNGKNIRDDTDKE